MRAPFSATRHPWRRQTCGALLAGALLAFPASHAADVVGVFGQRERTAGALIGILYDFKQNQHREPIPMSPRAFVVASAEFIDAGWDEGLLNKYYRVSRPLFTTELLIKGMDADGAPRAFGVEKTVKPKTWAVHYKAQVAVPETGTYRFVGEADDYMAVAVNSRTVLVAALPDIRMPTKWFAKERSGMWTGGQEGIPGDWMELTAGKPFDLDILIGESPGGTFRCQLAVQKKGVTYRQTNDKRYQLPQPFQLARNARTRPGETPWIGVP